MSNSDYAVIVVGGGHAGTEAAYACARMGCRALLITQNIATIGQMSCNPSIGGIGKSHLVYEIDALGGVMPRAADAAAIHVRTLNASRGPAVQATRAQQDRNLYRQAVRKILESEDNLEFTQQTVDDLIVDGNQVIGVVTNLGERIFAKTVILTTGTFLGGVIHIGNQQKSAGRAGDKAANELASRLRALNLRVGRLKTGTPPRLDSRSLDFSAMEIQAGDIPPPLFSGVNTPAIQPRQTNCHITYTNAETCKIIADNMHLSPLYSGDYDVNGPRYCPSIEVKIKRWFMTKGRSRHQIFVEPEGLDVAEVYPSGLSNCLPLSVQTAFIQTIPGFTNARITQPGYAIEYDYLDPRDLRPHLESRVLGGLFLAGQINGTTGYEEAAAQGIVAGINAACQVLQRPYWIPGRAQAYLGVLIDDLITRGTTEPYRMFTSRAEHRLLLRQDNCYERLTAIGRELGLINDLTWSLFQKRDKGCAAFMEFAGKYNIAKDSPLAEALSIKTGPETFANGISLADILKRPYIGLDDCFSFSCVGLLPGDNNNHQQPSFWGENPNLINNFKVNGRTYVCGFNFERSWAEHCVIEIKYAGYIKRAAAESERNAKQLNMAIPDGFDFAAINTLSNEAREIFTQFKPQSLACARKLPGITPAAINILALAVRRQATATTK